MPPDGDALQRRLSEAVGREHVLAGDAASAFTVDGVAPRVVVRPGSQEAVSAVVTACAAERAALVCWGGGTAMRFGNPPGRLDVVLSLERLRRIVELDDANLNVSAEAGVRLGELQAAALAKREFLPVDPPQLDRVTVGGLIASNASGPGRLLYGTARDWLLGLRLVLPNGERVRSGGKVIKNVSGYDLNKLIIGSMGTLGVVTEATFKLLPAPAMRRTVVAGLAQLEQVAALASRALASQLLPEAIEVLDAGALRAVERDVAFGAGSYGVAVSIAGSRETVERQVRDFRALFVDARASTASVLDESGSEVAWRAIRDVHARLAGGIGDEVVVKVAVPIGMTMQLFGSAERTFRRCCSHAVVTAHAGSGVVRAALLAREASPSTIREGVEALRAEAEAADGSLVVESAPIVLKRASLDAWGKPRDAFSVMQRLKAEFDPGRVMSPGRFVGGM